LICKHHKYLARVIPQQEGPTRYRIERHKIYLKTKNSLLKTLQRSLECLVIVSSRTTTITRRAISKMVAMTSGGGGGERSSHGHPGSSTGKNPLQEEEDPLVPLLFLVDASSSMQEAGDYDFEAWKTTFVQRFESLLEPQGIVQARMEYEAMKEKLKALAAAIATVKLPRQKEEEILNQGGGDHHLGGSGKDGEAMSASAEAADVCKTLNQVKQEVVEATQCLREWRLPAKDHYHAEDEVDDEMKKPRFVVGYNKYQLALVLVQDGFDGA
jgi:hypothetical protein